VLLLNRNPSKRLGGAKGAQEIKDHAFFATIDWKLAAERKLQPPKVAFDLQSIMSSETYAKGNEEAMKKIYDEIVESETDVFEDRNVEGWSFVNMGLAQQIQGQQKK